MAEGDVDPPEPILMVQAAGFDGIDFFRQGRSQPLICIQVQDPVSCSLGQGKIPLGGKILVPFPESNVRPGFPGQGHRMVRTAGIHHQQLVGTGPGRIQGRQDMFFLVFRQDNYRTGSHDESPFLIQPLVYRKGGGKARRQGGFCKNPPFQRSMVSVFWKPACCRL